MLTEIMQKQQQVYLVRLWPEHGEWRIRVSDLQSGQEYSFTMLEQLYQLLGQGAVFPVPGYTLEQNVWGYG